MKRLSSMLLLLVVASFAGACAPAYVASPGYYYGRPVHGWHRPRSPVVVVTPPPRVVVYRPGWR